MRDELAKAESRIRLTVPQLYPLHLQVMCNFDNFNYTIFSTGDDVD